MNKNFSKLVKMALLISLSVVGALLKIPSPTGTVAFDSLPGYFGALVIGPKEGAMIAGLGHLATAATTGFLLTLPIHLFIALQMAIIAYFVGVLKNKAGMITAVIVGIVLNGIVAPASFILIPGFGKAFFMMAFLSILVGSVANIILAALLSKKFTNGDRNLSMDR